MVVSRYFHERCPEGYGVLKRPKGNVKLERSGGLDYFVGGEGQCVFPALLTPGSVDGGYCRMVNVDIEHLRGGHLEFDPGVHDMHVHDEERTTTSSAT